MNNCVRVLLSAFCFSVAWCCSAVFSVAVAYQSAPAPDVWRTVPNNVQVQGASWSPPTSDQYIRQKTFAQVEYAKAKMTASASMKPKPAAMGWATKARLATNPASLVGMAVISGLLGELNFGIMPEGYLAELAPPGAVADPRPYYMIPSVYDAMTGQTSFSNNGRRCGQVSYDECLAYYAPVTPSGHILVGLNPNAGSYSGISCPLNYGGFSFASYNPPICYYGSEKWDYDPEVAARRLSPEEIGSIELPNPWADPNFWGLNEELAAEVVNDIPAHFPEQTFSSDASPSFPEEIPEPKPATIPSFTPEEITVEEIVQPQPYEVMKPDGSVDEVTDVVTCDTANGLICTVTQTVQNYISGVPNGEPVVTSTSAPDVSGIPTDCAFFPTLCAWLEWTKERPDDSDLPVIDLDRQDLDGSDFWVEKSTGLGGGSCPPDEQLSFSFGTATFSYSYFCDYATSIKPWVIAMAWFFSALIIVRFSW